MRTTLDTVMWGSQNGPTNQLREPFNDIHAGFNKMISALRGELQRLNKILQHDNGRCLGHDRRTADTVVLTNDQ